MIPYLRSARNIPLCIFFVLMGFVTQAQEKLRPIGRTYLVKDATIITSPGTKIENGSLLIKDGLIVAVGKNVSVPPEAVTIQGDSLFVYAGFIQGTSLVGIKKEAEEKQKFTGDPGNPPNALAGITPEQSVRDVLSPSDSAFGAWRSQGFVAAQLVPRGKMLPGKSSIVFFAGDHVDEMILVDQTALYATFTTARPVYPATEMGIMAKWRDLYRNASISKSNYSIYASSKSDIAPVQAPQVSQAFYPVIDKSIPVLFKSESMMDILRAMNLSRELNFSLVLTEVKEGWPIIDKIKATGIGVYLSLDLPKEEKEITDSVKATYNAERKALEKRKQEAVANYVGQAALFAKEGVKFGFSTLDMKPKDVKAAILRMIDSGLSEDAALAALTTSPALLMGLDTRMGTLKKGMIANVVVSKGSYFEKKSAVKHVFVNGDHFEIKDEVKKDKKNKSD